MIHNEIINFFTQINMAELKYLLLLTIPSTGIILTIYFILNKYFKNVNDLELIKLKKQNSKEIIPLKIQAYERILLYIQRISPETLTIKNVNPALTNQKLYDTLNHTIETEYEHNLTQQLYVSEKAWLAVNNMKNEIKQLIEVAYSKVEKDKPSIQLATTIIQIFDQLETKPTFLANQIIKNEFNQQF